MQTPLDKLKSLEQQATAAREALRQALREQFPEGTQINVILSATQVNPSPAEVVFYSHRDGNLRVRLLSAKQRSRRAIRDVHYSKVV